MKRQELLTWLVLILVVILLGLVGNQTFNQRKSKSDQGGSLNPEKIRDYAAALKANQLYAKAAENYDLYLSQANLSDPEKAKIDFNTANMLLDQVGDAEGALAHFLRVTDLYQEVDPQIVKESRKLAAECLEKLGRAGAAEHALVEASKLKTEGATEEVKAEEKDVLATIGDRITISRAEFEEAWKSVPQQSRDQLYGGETGREKFLQEMLSMRLFAEAAKRKGLDRDPEIQRRKRSVEEGLLASKLYQSEIAAKVELSEPDMKLFYEAHKDHYKEPASVEVAHILTTDSTRCLEAKAAIEKGSPFAEVARQFSTDARTKDNGGKIGRLQQARIPLEKKEGFDPMDIPIPGIGKSREFVSAAFAIPEVGQLAGPVKTEKGFHLITLLSKAPETEKSFEDSRNQIDMEFRQQREEQRRAELVAELMKAHQVRVYANRLKD